MCKVAMVAGIKPAKVEKVWEFIKAISKPMSKYNADGLGYAAITAEGKLFGERWLNNDTAFNEPSMNSPVTDVFMGAVEQKKEVFEYNSFGEVVPNKAVAITLHTRYATSPKGMNNTHPFNDEGISLIHNGVIRNDDEFELKSTCDSEAILRAYQGQKVAQDSSNIEAMADSLRGYYACGVLTNTNIGPTLDIFKSNAQLNVAYIKQLECYIVSTDDADIKDTTRLFGYDMGAVFKIFDGKFIRINAITGTESQVLTFRESITQAKYYSTPYQSSTWTNSTGTNTKDTTQNKNVVPFYTKGKSRNTDISAEFLDYFAGAVRLEELTEREIQECIMEQERAYGKQHH